MCDDHKKLIEENASMKMKFDKLQVELAVIKSRCKSLEQTNVQLTRRIEQLEQSTIPKSDFESFVASITNTVENLKNICHHEYNYQKPIKNDDENDLYLTNLFNQIDETNNSKNVYDIEPIIGVPESSVPELARKIKIRKQNSDRDVDLRPVLSDDTVLSYLN